MRVKMRTGSGRKPTSKRMSSGSKRRRPPPQLQQSPRVGVKGVGEAGCHENAGAQGGETRAELPLGDKEDEKETVAAERQRSQRAAHLHKRARLGM